MDIERLILPIIGTAASIGGAFAVVKTQIQSILVKADENHKDINILGEKIRQLDARMILDDGRSKYITRPECDRSQKEICDRQAKIEEKICLVFDRQAKDTERIIETIRELSRG